MGIRIGDLIRPERLRERVNAALDEKNFLIEHRFKKPKLEADEVIEEYLEYGNKLKPHIRPIPRTCSSSAFPAVAAYSSRVLREHCWTSIMVPTPLSQSSNVVAGNVSCGSGVSPNRLDQILGIVKAYSTRVGQGGFPTELAGTIWENRSRKRGRSSAQRPEDRGDAAGWTS